jgi:4'-phosphopantetheinyl transferase EntD
MKMKKRAAAGRDTWSKILAREDQLQAENAADLATNGPPTWPDGVVGPLPHPLQRRSADVNPPAAPSAPSAKRAK